MLHYQTIDAKTLELLKNIQEISIFNKLRLVGGTSLALQIGHRLSIDLDLFGKLNADEISITNELSKIGNFKIINTSENIKVFLINDIKVDIVNYPYEWIDDAIYKDDLVLASIKDIAAMKLAAITGRGTKKDFIDFYFLLKRYSLEQLIELYKQKYPDSSIFMLLKSIPYFDDAEIDINPKMLIDTKWEQVKTSILHEVNRYLS